MRSFCIDECEPRFIADVSNADIVIPNASMMIWMTCGQHHDKHRLMSWVKANVRMMFYHREGEDRSGLRC